MRNLNYDSPGSHQDLIVFKTILQVKSKKELILIIGNIAAACDIGEKGYVDGWEDMIRHTIGYTKGNGIDHEESCGCPRCDEEQANAKKIINCMLIRRIYD